MASEIVKAQNIDQAGALEVRAQVNQIQYLMKNVLKEGEHYGTVPGCGKKPTLLQPGAEKIAYMFHFVPTYEVTRHELGNGHTLRPGPNPQHPLQPGPLRAIHPPKQSRGG